MAINTLSLNLPANARILGQSSEQGKPVFEYKDGKRTDAPRLHPLTNRPLFRHSVSAKLSDTQAGECVLLLDSEAPVGVHEDVKLAPGAVVSVRPEDQFSLALTIVGSLAGEKRA